MWPVRRPTLGRHGEEWSRGEVGNRRIGERCNAVHGSVLPREDPRSDQSRGTRWAGINTCGILAGLAVVVAQICLVMCPVSVLSCGLRCIRACPLAVTAAHALWILYVDRAIIAARHRRGGAYAHADGILAVVAHNRGVVRKTRWVQTCCPNAASFRPCIPRLGASSPRVADRACLCTRSGRPCSRYAKYRSE